MNKLSTLFFLVLTLLLIATLGFVGDANTKLMETIEIQQKVISEQHKVIEQLSNQEIPEGSYAVPKYY